MDWLILLLLVPAIVIPVVLLFGFSGCGFSVTIPPGEVAIPTIVSAKPLDNQTVILEWTINSTDVVSFEVQRVKLGEPPPSPTAQSSPFVDTGLIGGTTYFYRVRAVRLSDGQDAWSDFATVVTWAPAFQHSLDGQESFDASNSCIVQRIDPAELLRGGNLVSVTVRAGTTGDLQLTAATISNKAPSGDDFDSAAQPVSILYPGPNLVTAGTNTGLAPVEFALDGTSPILIAFDVGAPGHAVFTRNVPHTMYFGDPQGGGPVQQAAVMDRSGFTTQLNELWLVERIDVATKWPPIS
jgi:hypothetical protein